MKRLFSFCTLLLLIVPAAETSAAGPHEAGSLEPGFVSIFNGKDLSGWDGDPRLWSVKDGAIRGQTTEENPARGNTFCVWRGGKLKNFILKVKFASRTATPASSIAAKSSTSGASADIRPRLQTVRDRWASFTTREAGAAS